MHRDSTYSRLFNRYLRPVFQWALVSCGVAASRAKSVFFMRIQGICGKETLLFSAIGIAGPDAQLFAQLCLSFLGTAGGMALAYAGRNRRDQDEAR